MQFDPAFFASIGSLVDRYGLPLALMAALGWALFTRRLVLGSELDRSKAASDAELAYREARRLEERDGRLAAEGAMRDLSAAMTKLAEVQDAAADAILDRLDGREEPRGTRR